VAQHIFIQNAAIQKIGHGGCAEDFMLPIYPKEAFEEGSFVV
jgi:hypothetical protein